MTANRAAAVAEMKRTLTRLRRDQAFDASILYQSGEVDAALKIWRRLTKLGGGDGLKALRSWTVVWHSRAYQYEIDGRHEEAADAWQRSLKGWGEILSSSSLAGLLREASAVDAKTYLEGERVGPLREVIAESILQPNLSLAAAAVDEGEEDRASRHVSMVREAGLPEEVVASAMASFAERLCPVYHGEVDHLLYSEDTAPGVEKRARFVHRRVPEHINGPLALVVLWLWRANSAISRSKGVDSVWDALRAHAGAGLLSGVAAMADVADDPVIQRFARARLRSVADLACYIKLRTDGMLKSAVSDCIGRVNDSVEAGNIAGIRRALTEYPGLAARLRQRYEDDGVRFCEGLCKRFGEVEGLDRLRTKRASDTDWLTQQDRESSQLSRKVR